MNLYHEIVQGVPPVTVLNVAGRVDSSNYLSLIDEANQLLSNGTEYLLLDLENCDFLSSSGLFAVHSIALKAHKIPALDPQNGWASLRKMVDDNQQYKQKFKIVNVQPNVLRVLDSAGFLSILDVHSDMRTALAAFTSMEQV
jgi:anti-anti-sigma regulatory factor